MWGFQLILSNHKYGNTVAITIMATMTANNNSSSQHERTAHPAGGCSQHPHNLMRKVCSHHSHVPAEELAQAFPPNKCRISRVPFLQAPWPSCFWLVDSTCCLFKADSRCHFISVPGLWKGPSVCNHQGVFPPAARRLLHVVTFAVHSRPACPRSGHKLAGMSDLVRVSFESRQARIQVLTLPRSARPRRVI